MLCKFLFGKAFSEFHVTFIEIINVDKNTNAFIKIFWPNHVNVYNIYAFKNTFSITDYLTDLSNLTTTF